MKFLVTILALTVLLATGVSATTVSYGPYSIGLGSTNWSNSISLQMFNPALGTLNSITFTLDGHAEGTAKFESQDVTPETITMDLSAILRLKRPDSTILVTAIPLASTSDDVTGWDGVDDFAGTSGRTYGDLSADQSEFATKSSASDKTLFTGTGLISLPVTADGASNASGGGNVLQQFITKASASASVTYDYTPPVPEPSSLLALASGLLPIGLLIRRRR